MKLKTEKLKGFKPMLLLIAVFSLMISVHGQGTGGTGFVQGVCSGSGSNGAVIPLNNVLSGQGTGANNLLFLSTAIMLTMLLVVALLYMVSYILNLNLLKNMVKAEVGEVIITAIIVFIFVGSFNALAGGVAGGNPAVFNIAGTGFGRNLFVGDCTFLGNASIGLILPFLGINLIRFVGDTITSFTVTVMPSGFGFGFMPFAGFGIFDKMLGYLDDITFAFILINLATMVLLGIIFALFPIFLYAGIILRTLPWTRAAGGAMLGLFVGFYIAFPLLLHVMLGSYTVPTVSTININDQSIFTALQANSATAFLGDAGQALTNSQLFIFGSQYGIVNGFIADVIEPAVFTFLAIVIAFIISFDISEAVGDTLGAPNLTVGGIFSKTPGIK